MSIAQQITRRFSRRSRASGYCFSEAVDFGAATENPAAALLPPDFLIAHLPACRAAPADLTALTQGRTIDAGKLHFAESPLFDSQQIARIYRDDGLFFGAVKIENDTARTTLCCHNRHHKRQLRPLWAELSFFGAPIRKECNRSYLNNEMDKGILP